MRITVVSRLDTREQVAHCADFDAPGGTIGRCPGNRLVLPCDAPALCRVQAVLRSGEDGWRLLNLSAMGSVKVNRRLLGKGQDAPVRPGDELVIGPFVLSAQGEAAAQAETAARADADAAGGPAAPAAAGIFAGIVGPGALPVGSAPDMSTHPFDMASAAVRNSDDPLAQLPAMAQEAPPSLDPLALFPAFPDAAPSLFGDAAASEDDGLRTWLQSDRTGRLPPQPRDHVPQLGGFMRPAAVARDEKDE